MPQAEMKLRWQSCGHQGRWGLPNRLSNRDTSTPLVKTRKPIGFTNFRFSWATHCRTVGTEIIRAGSDTMLLIKIFLGLFHIAVKFKITWKQLQKGRDLPSKVKIMQLFYPTPYTLHTYSHIRLYIILWNCTTLISTFRILKITV